MIVKVCGMKYSENIKKLDKIGVNIIGFIFHEKSPRFVQQKPDYLPQNSLRAGVFVDKDIEYILSKVREFGLDFVQLHGQESPDICRTLKEKGLKVIKVFHAKDNFIDKMTSRYEGTCKYFLFDTPCKELGGSGRKFDWDILQNYHGDTPFILSGGIKPEGISDFQMFKHPKLIGIDINSGFEISPALKDIEKISVFIKNIKQ